MSKLKQWVELLRSGKYTQGTGRLINDKLRRCCLGVACDLFPDVELDPKQWNFRSKSYDEYSELGEQLDFRHLIELGISEFQQSIFIDFNDGCHRERFMKRMAELKVSYSVAEKYWEDAETGYYKGQKCLDFNQIAELIENYLIGGQNDAS